MRSVVIRSGILKADFKGPFRQFVNDSHRPLQLAIEDMVEDICANPDLDEGKIADLTGILVYKFRFNRQEYPVAYRPPTKEQPERREALEFLVIDFYQVGPHE